MKLIELHHRVLQLEVVETQFIQQPQSEARKIVLHQMIQEVPDLIKVEEVHQKLVQCHAHNYARMTSSNVICQKLKMQLLVYSGYCK